MRRVFFLTWLALLFTLGTAHLPAQEKGEELTGEDSSTQVRLRLLPDAPPVPDAVKTEILEWVHKFQNAVYRMRIREFIEMTDMEALAAGLKSADEAVSVEERAKMGRIMTLIFEKNFPGLKEIFSFESAEIRRIDLRGANAIVLARVKEPTEGAELKVRWWLRQENDRWRMTDYEIVTANMRLSVLFGVGGEAGKSAGPVATAFVKMFAAQQSSEFQLLVETAEAVEKETMSPALREILIMGKIGALAELNEAEKIMAELEKLEAVAPEQPMLAYFRATIAEDEGDHANVVKWGEKFGAASGHDGETWQMLTDALLALEQPGKARVEAEKWMADYPESVDAVWAYCRSLKEDPKRANRLEPHLERLAKAEKIETFAIYADDANDEEVLAMTVAFMRANGHDDESVREYEETLELLRERLQPKAGLTPGPTFRGSFDTFAG